MLSFEQLHYNINGKSLINNLSVSLLPSSITYVRGDNGSGKTSLLKMIAGIQEPSAGKILWRGADINDLPKPYCLYIGHKTGLKLELTVFENLKFWALVYNSPEILDAAIHYFDLEPILGQKCYKLSAGTQKRVTLSKLLSCHSKLWLLDEIEQTLDKERKNLVNNLIVSKAAGGGIVVIASHEEYSFPASQTIDLASC